MSWIPGGRFKMGSEEFRAEEAPVRDVAVEGFWIERHDVTNAQFTIFVRETGYATLAERVDRATGRPAGSIVFAPPSDVRNLQDIAQWWRLETGANWRQPEGPGSDLKGLQNHPVVHVSHEDAEAYAKWAGRTLPTEAQWEFAARGGRDGETFAWGPEPDTDDAPRANRWRGIFPVFNTGSKGYKGTSPVGCFPANPFGLFDMTGNVWQWTRDAWTVDHNATKSAAVVHPTEPVYVIKGGSYLCATNFCMRYRPAARQPGDGTSSASHIGFRTVLSLNNPPNNPPRIDAQPVLRP